MPEYAQVVRELLASSGIAPSEKELEELRAKYPIYRDLARRQYLVPEAREEALDLNLDIRK